MGYQAPLPPQTPNVTIQIHKGELAGMKNSDYCGDPIVTRFAGRTSAQGQVKGKEPGVHQANGPRKHEEPIAGFTLYSLLFTRTE